MKSLFSGMRDISQGTHQQMTSYILFSMWYYLYISCRAFAMGGIGEKKIDERVEREQELEIC